MSGDFTFLKGNIYTIILCSLYGTNQQSGDKYGYEIAKEIKERTDNKYEIKQPTLYSYLKRLEQQSLIESYWGTESNGGRRRYYRLTQQGRNECERFVAEWEYHKTVLNTLVDTTESPFEITQKDATPLFGEKLKRHKTEPKKEIENQEEIAKRLNALLNGETSETEAVDEATDISDGAKIDENDVAVEESAFDVVSSDKDVTESETENLELTESEPGADSTDAFNVYGHEENLDETDFNESENVEDSSEPSNESIVADEMTDDEHGEELNAEHPDAENDNDATDNSVEYFDETTKEENADKPIDETETVEFSTGDVFGGEYIENPLSVADDLTDDVAATTVIDTETEEEHKSKFEVRQDDADEFMSRFDARARSIAESREEKEKPKENEENYQHVLMNVIGEQLDDMREYNSEQREGAQKYYTDHPVALEDVADGLAKQGIRLRIYNRASAIYKSKTLMPVSGVLCKSAWLTYIVAIVYFGVLIATSIANSNWKPFLITLACLAVVPIGFSIFALHDPSRKEKPIFDVKRYLVATGILAAIIVLAALGISIISGIELNDYTAVSLQILLPLGIAILLPIYVLIFYRFYKKY